MKLDLVLKQFKFNILILLLSEQNSLSVWMEFGMLLRLVGQVNLIFI